MEIGLVTLLSGGGVLVGKVLPKLVALAHKSYKDRIRAQLNEKTLADLARRLAECTSVKTIWRYEEPVSLYTFYYPGRVEIRWGGIVLPRNVLDLKSRHVVIEGMVGMGKSLLLKFLIGQELRAETSTGRIPIFLELRRLSAGQSLFEFITSGLKRYGFDVDDELTGLYLRSGLIVLFFDGFDEVEASQKTNLVDQLEALAQMHGDDLQIVVTSRPESGIQNSTFFTVVKILPVWSKYPSARVPRGKWT